jgi:hypothetical protein
MEAAAREPLGRACAAKMDYRGKLPLLLTAVFLNRKVTAILARPLKVAASVQQKRELAAIIHLCGAKLGQGVRAPRLPSDRR